MAVAAVTLFYPLSAHSADALRSRPAIKLSQKHEADRSDEKGSVATARYHAPEIAGVPKARFWADNPEALTDALPDKPGPWLVLSGGGGDGAFGAGLLVGWEDAGGRPDFSVVTGASTGALIAVYAFLGPRFDKQLAELYTTVSAVDIFEVASTPDSLLDTWPLREEISKRVTPELVAAVADRHRAGHRLFVVTTNLDTERPVVWDMGAIATRATPEALKLFRNVLLASTSIPGLFPPVRFETVSDGRPIVETHVDGSVTGPFYMGPLDLLLTHGGLGRLRMTSLDVVLNTGLGNDVSPAGDNTIAILGRSLGIAFKLGTRVAVVEAQRAAAEARIPLRLAMIGGDFRSAQRGPFDPDYLKALFAYGIVKAHARDQAPQN